MTLIVNVSSALCRAGRGQSTSLSPVALIVSVSSCSQECRMVLESCIGCSNRCVHARRPGPCRARVPPRSSETAQRRAVEGITWAALHRLLRLPIGM